MVSDNEILDFLIKLEVLKEKVEKENYECSGCNFNYEHQDNIIKIEYDWYCPEEGGYYEYIIDLETMSCKYSDDVSTVYGSFKNNDTYIIKDFDVFLNRFF